MDLPELVDDITAAIVELDTSKQCFGTFQPGAGPFSEPKLVSFVRDYLNRLPKYLGTVQTKRRPDLLIPGKWAVEFKITRPFGDNGKEAENWSVNLLHPYPGNVSTISDCYKLASYEGSERRVILVVGYEHVPARIDLGPLVKSFELIAKTVAGFSLSARVEKRHDNLVHPVHQSLRVFAWELI